MGVVALQFVALHWHSHHCLLFEPFDPKHALLLRRVKRWNAMRCIALPCPALHYVWVLPRKWHSLECHLRDCALRCAAMLCFALPCGAMRLSVTPLLSLLPSPITRLLAFVAMLCAVVLYYAVLCAALRCYAFNLDYSKPFNRCTPVSWSEVTEATKSCAIFNKVF